MKILAALALAVAFAGCTANDPNAEHKPLPRTFGEKRVYSGDELNSTGRSTTGRQLERLDPSIQTSGPGE